MKEEIEEEKRKLREEFEEQIKQIKAQFEEERSNKENLSREIEVLKNQFDRQISSLDNSIVEVSTTKAVKINNKGNKSNKSNRKSSGQQQQASVNRNQIESQEQHEIDGNISANDDKESNDPIKRLRQLEEMMVGGEQANNEELKKKRYKKKKHAEERKALLADALKNGDDEEFMLRVYDSVQEEVKYKSKLFEKEAQKVSFLENEVKDLQREFEQEREEYLDTIRKQEKQNKLLTKLLQKVQPLITHDCNYYNLDRIQSLSVWNEELQEWVLPELKREKLSLPSMANGTDSEISLPVRKLNQQQQQQQQYKQQQQQQEEVQNEEPDRYRMKLENSNYNESVNYFKNKRQAELLNQTYDLRQNMSNGRLSPIRNGLLFDRNLRNKK